MFITGIGPLTAQPGPEGETIWSPLAAISSSLFDDPVEVNVLLAEGRSADTTLIAMVLGDFDHAHGDSTARCVHIVASEAGHWFTNSQPTAA
ncbi:hypothetical protein [Nocardia tengchongensis]